MAHRGSLHEVFGGEHEAQQGYKHREEYHQHPKQTFHTKAPYGVLDADKTQKKAKKEKKKGVIIGHGGAVTCYRTRKPFQLQHRETLKIMRKIRLQIYFVPTRSGKLFSAFFY